MLYRKTAVFLMVSIFTVLFAFAAGAAEFKADMTIQSEEGSQVDGRIFVSNKNVRQEIKASSGEQVLLVDGNSDVMYVLIPDQKMYMQRKNTQFIPDESEDPEKYLAAQGSVEKVGTESIEDYKCDKYHVNNHGEGTGETTLWISRKLNYPLKIFVENSQGKTMLNYSNVVEKDLDDSLFSLPEDYNEVEM